MNREIIIEPTKRFVPIKRYCEISGLSYATVNHMLNSGQLPYITTESGQRKVDTMTHSADSNILLDKLEKTEKMLTALCRQFNTSI